MSFRVEVTVPRGLAKADTEIVKRRRTFVRRVATVVRDDARRRLGPSRKIGPSLKVVVLSDEAAEIRSNHPGAKAQDRGAFIAAKRGTHLRFRVRRTGDLVYTKGPVRIKAKKYLTNALAPNNKQAAADAGFRDVYGPLVRELNTPNPK